MHTDTFTPTFQEEVLLMMGFELAAMNAQTQRCARDWKHFEPEGTFPWDADEDVKETYRLMSELSHKAWCERMDISNRAHCVRLIMNEVMDYGSPLWQIIHEMSFRRKEDYVD